MASTAADSHAGPEEGQAPATGSSAPSEPSHPAAGPAGAVEGSRPAPAPEASGQAGRPKTGARTRSGSRGRKRRKRSPVKDKPGRRRREREREREQRKGRVLGSEGPARAADQILVTAPICRESRARYMFGNYDQYYKQRFDRYATVDPRVQGVLLKAGNIFADKVVLDIGCNTGFITFLVAALGARQVEGVDIDVTCISRALRYLRWLKQKGYKTLPEEQMHDAREEGSRRAAEAAEAEAPAAPAAAEAEAPSAPSAPSASWYTKQYPVSYVQSRGHIPYHAKPLEAGALQKALSSAKVLEKAVPVNPPAAPRPGFPYNIEFRSENVLYTQVEGNRNVQYDVVLLFRLTKWIHINWGDLGIKRLFTRCNEWLRLGGLLVLEVKDLAGQPYAKEKHVSAGTRATRDGLLLLPGDFDWFLTNAYGFEKLSPYYIFEQGMRAPLQIYRKVAKVQALDEEQPRPAEMRPPAPPVVIRPRNKGQLVPPRQPLHATGEAAPSTEAEAKASTASEAQARKAEGSEVAEPAAKRLRTESEHSESEGQ